MYLSVVYRIIYFIVIIIFLYYCFFLLLFLKLFLSKLKFLNPSQLMTNISCWMSVQKVIQSTFPILPTSYQVEEGSRGMGVLRTLVGSLHQPSRALIKINDSLEVLLASLSLKDYFQ